MPMPTMRIVLLDFFFFFGASSSSSRARALPGDFLATAVPPACPPFLPAAPAASSSSGDSTRKRYLHFGQSIFLPTSEGLLMVTIASQLGHCTLKPVVAAIIGLR